MEVLMFGWEFPPYHNGGLGIATYHLAHALARQGVSLTFVLPKKLPVDSNEFKLLFAEGSSQVKVKQIDSLLTPYMTSGEYSEKEMILRELQRYGASLLEEVKRYADTVRNFIKDGEYDIIHAHDWLTVGAGLAAKVELERPLVKHVHASEVERSGGKRVNQAVFDIELNGMNNADAVVTVSQKTKDIVNSRYGVSEHKTHVIHNGIDMSEHDPSAIPINTVMQNLKDQGKKIVLYLGRLTGSKAPDMFIKAAAKAISFDQDLIFVVAGKGEMETQLVALTHELGIGENVLFVGWISDKVQINSLYKTADLFIMPSVMEPFGLVPLESMINNTPTIISKQSGVSEVVQHALKVDFWDIDAMVNKILAVTSHVSLHKTLQNHGFEEVKGITWDKAAEKCVNLYENLIHMNQTKRMYGLV